MATAEARNAGAQAEALVTTQGGRAADRAEIESNLNQAARELAAAQRELASVERLASRKRH